MCNLNVNVMNEALNLPLFFTALNKHNICIGHTVRVVLMLILASEIPLIQAEILDWVFTSTQVYAMI